MRMVEPEAERFRQHKVGPMHIATESSEHTDSSGIGTLWNSSAHDDRPAVSKDHPAIKEDFTEEHAVPPGLVGIVFPILALLLVVAGDFASFNIALSRTFTTLSGWLVFLLTAAMTAAAVLLMVEAGQAEAKRRGRNHGSHGRSPVRWRVFAWLLLGVTALLLRLAAPPEGAETGGFGTDSGFGADFGAQGSAGFGDAAGSGLMYLGPLELHTANLTSALALLAIFVAGGVGAFWFGREFNNPRLVAVRRASWRVRGARREVERARGKVAGAALALDEIENANEQYLEARAALARLSELEHELSVYDKALRGIAEARQRAEAAAAEVDEVRARAATVEQDRALLERELQHAAMEAKHRVRVRLAAFTGEPGATSGLTEGGEA